MTESIRKENQSPADIISRVQRILRGDLREQVNKVRFVRELAMNLCEDPDITGQDGERAPIHGLFYLLEDITEAYDDAMHSVNGLIKEYGEQEVTA